MISSAVNHIKTHRLKRRLGLKTWQVVGLLESLWLFTSLNAPDGAIGRHSNEDIAAWMEWDGNADDLIEHLIGAGWIDRSQTHRLLIHDWQDHAPGYVKGNVTRHGKEFAKELPSDAPKDAPKEPPMDHPPSLAQRSVVKPSAAERSETVMNTPTASGPRETYLTGPSGASKRFIEAYPRKSKPKATEKQFDSTVAELVGVRGMTDVEAAEFLIDRASLFAGMPAGLPPPPGQDEDWRPAAVNWLANGCFDEPVTEWKKPNTKGSKNGVTAIGAGQVYYPGAVDQPTGF